MKHQPVKSLPLVEYPEDSPVTKLLIEGREKIVQGWCQGSYLRRGGYCMVGALIYSTENYNLVAEAESVIHSLTYDYIPRWNDNLNRTKEQVIALFDRAIIASREAA